ncbi:MAG: tripartite tricarboxylate transporter TctB family protein [Paracoccaceae bacterium]
MQQDNGGRALAASTTERLIAVVVLGLGALFFGFGLFEYGFWQNKGPGSGFFPTIFGAGAMFCGLSRLRIHRITSESLSTASLRPVALAALAVFAGYGVGLVAALSIAVAAWMRFIGGERTPLSLIIGASFFLFVYLVFWRWLGINFDFGLLGRLVEGGAR